MILWLALGWLGGFLFVHADWHSIFWFLVLIGVALWIANWRLLPETLVFTDRGLLRLDEMISATARLDEINDRMRAMKAGEVTRSVLLFDEG